MENWLGHSWTGPPQEVVPRVASASYISREPGPPSRCIVRDLWVLDYSLSDCGRARVGSARARWWPRTGGIVHLYPPGTPYWEDASGAEVPLREAWALFHGGERAGLASLMMPEHAFGRFRDPSGIVGRHLREMAMAGSRLGEEGFWPAQASLASLLGLLHGSIAQPRGPRIIDSAPAPGPGLVEKARDYFRAHLREKITIADVAAHLSMSPSAFSHGFRDEAGRPPITDLTALRIDFAKGLLLRGLKLDAVAFQTGFYDAFHLSKTFKRVCGVSPSRWRREFRWSERSHERPARNGENMSGT